MRKYIIPDMTISYFNRENIVTDSSVEVTREGVNAPIAGVVTNDSVTLRQVGYDEVFGFKN